MIHLLLAVVIVQIAETQAGEMPQSTECECPNLMTANTQNVIQNMMSDLGSDNRVVPECTAKRPPRIIFQNAIWSGSLRWLNATIPYLLDGYDDTQTAAIMSGINTLNAQTCLSLIPRTTEANYAKVFNGDGCWSYIGMIGGEQELSLKDSASSSCLHDGVIMHEFLHAAGFFHEHTRPDRDDFVCVNFTNIIDDAKSNFDIEPNADTLGTTYTFASVMHYGGTFFDIEDGYLTLFPKSCNASELAAFGQRDGLHAVDIERVGKLYAGLGAC